MEYAARRGGARWRGSARSVALATLPGRERLARRGRDQRRKHLGREVHLEGAQGDICRPSGETVAR